MNINVTDTPYLISLERSAVVPKIEVLNQLKVCAVVIEVSDYFDEITHQKSRYPVNTQMKSQLTYLIQNEFPYGVYFKLRGRTVKEVEDEAKYFLQTIKDYSVEVGVWLDLYLYSRNTKSTNDSLLDKCRDLLNAAGYKNQIGLYCDKNQLNYFDWTKHSSDYLLWIRDEVTSNLELTSIMVDSKVPDDFFKVIK